MRASVVIGSRKPPPILSPQRAHPILHSIEVGTALGLIQRVLYQTPASPSRLRVPPPPSSRGIANAPLFAVPYTAFLAANSLEQRWRDVRDSHIALDGWYWLYESLELGIIPKPEQCNNATMVLRHKECWRKSQGLSPCARTALWAFSTSYIQTRSFNARL
jgi:hypothetical protein